MRNSIVRKALLVAGLASLSSPAAAQGYVEVGGFGTQTRFDRTLPYDQSSAGGGRLSLGSGAGANAFVLEAEGAYFPSLANAGPIAVRYVPARARLLYTPTFGSISLLMGGGGVRNAYFAIAPDSPQSIEWGYTALGGLRFALGHYMALRVEGVLDYMTHPINASADVKRTTHRAVQAGLSFPLWSSRIEAKERPAVVAAAPVAAAPVAVAPAPVMDADRDGVADSRDQCSATPAGSTVDADGCQVYRDSDSDGVIDPKDLCPATPAGEPIDGRGCTAARDSDMDGVPDVRDRCANTPSGTPVNSVGCPMPEAPAPAPVVDTDADKDGVPDSRDKCPGTVAGSLIDATGCPAALFKGPERTVTLRGVNFEPSKDDLTASSLAILDEVARQLVDAPSVRVEIGGHTDARGPYSRNLRLSLARAESVRAYLIMRGVGADRLVARGYGMGKPVAGNESSEGRAMNRRVELKRLD